MCWGGRKTAVSGAGGAAWWLNVSLCSCVFHVLSFLYPLPTFNSLPRSPWGERWKNTCVHMCLSPSKRHGGWGDCGGGCNMARQRRMRPHSLIFRRETILESKKNKIPKKLIFRLRSSPLSCSFQSKTFLDAWYKKSPERVTSLVIKVLFVFTKTFFL